MLIGFIGTGVMGNAMARCLLEAGHELTVYDVSREATDNLCAMGARWAAGPRAVAAASEVIFTSLPGPSEMETVLLDPRNGVLAGLEPGCCYIDTTTNLPSVFRKVAKACHERGVDALDAPVSGRPPEMAMMVGGDVATLAKYRPLLEAMAKHIFHMGETGKGMVAKAVNQFLIVGGFLVGAEGLLLGAKAGLDPYVLYQTLVVSAGGRSVNLEPFQRTVFKGDFGRTASGGGPLDRWIKDLSCASEVAHEVGLSARILALAEDVLHDAQSHGWGEDIWYGAVRVLEELAGAQLRAPSSE